MFHALHKITICQFPVLMFHSTDPLQFVDIVDNIDVKFESMENIHCRKAIQREIEFEWTIFFLLVHK